MNEGLQKHNIIHSNITVKLLDLETTCPKTYLWPHLVTRCAPTCMYHVRSHGVHETLTEPPPTTSMTSPWTTCPSPSTPFPCPCPPTSGAHHSLGHQPLCSPSVVGMGCGGCQGLSPSLSGHPHLCLAIPIFLRPSPSSSSHPHLCPAIPIFIRPDHPHHLDHPAGPTGPYWPLSYFLHGLSYVLFP